MSSNNNTALKPIDKLKAVLNAESVQQQFENALKDQAPLFTASIIDLVGQDAYLQQCDPKLVVAECLKAATLRLPISKSLGFAYIVPYKEKGTPKPQFQLGYKGMIQLAIRSGQYRYINADKVYMGEIVKKDRITGDIRIEGEPESDEIIGYFAYIELLNGFKKIIYWSMDEIIKHAKRFSKSYGNKLSAWATDFDAMAKKTVLRHLISKYGIMSIEMQMAFNEDAKVDREGNIQTDIEANANQGEIIDVKAEESEENGEENGGDLTSADAANDGNTAHDYLTPKSGAQAGEQAAMQGPGF